SHRISMDGFPPFSFSVVQRWSCAAWLANGCVSSLLGADQQLLLLCNYRGRLVQEANNILKEPFR
ncbi:hypothetical protein, partial [Peribacillus butanolivorans]|uniref:hypothetical protein n=1 Tax=Peribacillus butanolivorans TaxID=421767 RepID=UPI003804AA5D